MSSWCRGALRRALAVSSVALVAAGGLAAGVPAGAAAAVVPTAAVRPNVLVVQADDARFDALAAMPKTRGWLAKGVTFTGAQTAIPSCCPSRSAFMTGRYAHNGVRLQSQALQLDAEGSIGRYLQRAGYRTAMAGKFLTSWPLDTPPPGFERHTLVRNGYYDYYANVDGVGRRESSYSTTFLARQLRGYLRDFEATDATPWYGYLAPQAPHIAGGHDSYAVPETRYAAAPVDPCVQPGEADRRDKPPYVSWTVGDPEHLRLLCESQIRALRTLDDELDLTLRQLRLDGEINGTMIVFTSDNGYSWGEHGRTSKFVPYAPSVRVPLAVRWDGRLAPGVDPRMVSNVDLLPTVLQAAGIAPDPALPLIDGRSLLLPPTRTVQLTEYFTDPANGAVPSWAALTEARRKYVETSTVNPTTGATGTFREYYDLATDPGELTNLLRDDDPTNDPPAAEVSALSERLRQLRTCRGAACP